MALGIKCQHKMGFYRVLYLNVPDRLTGSSEFKGQSVRYSFACYSGFPQVHFKLSENISGG